MKMLATPHDFGNELLKALGVEGKGITSITLRVAANQLPQVRITQDVYQEDSDKWVQVIKRYQLVPREPA